MTAMLVLLAGVLWLAYENGANDNFKGVATLYGSGAVGYRGALAWATATTIAGSLVSIMLAERLIKIFSGKGLVPEALLGSPHVLAIVGVSAAGAITLATVLGMPTSTTHALAGALLGIGIASASQAKLLPAFAQLFAAPLLLSPIAAIVLTVNLYPVLHWFRLRSGITRDTCACVEAPHPEVASITPGGTAVARTRHGGLYFADATACETRYDGHLLGIRADTAVNAMHYLSSGTVCFSRAVNDTPKIAALLVAASAAGSQLSLLAVAAAMAVGGLLQARKVAETMSQRITGLNPGQGLCANLATAGLVLVASRLGMPVSTTHVSCGAIFGIGLVKREANTRVIAAVLLTWLTTLPIAATISAALFMLFHARLT